MPTISLSPMMILLLSASAGLLWILAVWAVHMYTAEKRVAADDEIKSKKKNEEDQTFILYRITSALGRPFRNRALNALSDEQQKAIRRRLEAAGNPNGLTVELYVQRKVGDIILFGSTSLVLFAGGSFLWSIITFLFVFMTELDLYSRARKRQDEIQEKLPDFLDVLAVTVGAGLSFRQALERVTDSMPSVLSEEFRVALRQMDLGTSRRQAFRSLAERNKNESLGKFVTAIQQAEELGAPLAQALSEIGDDMRRDDAQYMRRKAQKLNPRVTGVTAATLLPGLIILICGAMFFGMDVDFSSLGNL
ncbi:tight adherence protein C [Haloactinospora alba]|uniref:Tight adherence protein C n=1 Tax=Haloactinospora alba TaxID=405555 RepID=A0A543NGR9_9ACTN|nr:type II secretion system F family protein [Haloactinospora alba]TQN30930.1 tight adherence protein C [Haloactinospora alba]